MEKIKINYKIKFNEKIIIKKYDERSNEIYSKDSYGNEEFWEFDERGLIGVDLKGIEMPKIKIFWRKNE